VEGATTALSMEAIAAEHGLAMPISAEVARIVRGDTVPAAAVAALMAREPASEFTLP